MNFEWFSELLRDSVRLHFNTQVAQLKASGMSHVIVLPVTSRSTYLEHHEVHESLLEKQHVDLIQFYLFIFL